MRISVDSLGEFPGGPVVRTVALSLPRAWVQSLVGELKSHKLHDTAKKKKNRFFGGQWC